MVCSPDTYFFNFFTELLQRDTLAQYLIKIYLDYELCMSIDQIKKIVSYLKKKKKNQILSRKTMTNTEYPNYKTRHANIYVFMCMCKYIYIYICIVIYRQTVS